MEHDEIPENGGKPDAVAALIRTVGRREEPPREAYDAVLAVAQQALRRQVAARRQRRFTGWAIAASILVAAAIVFLMPRSPVSERADRVATIDRIIGSVELGSTSGWRPIADSRRGLAGGDRIRTLAGGRAALALADGQSLRLAASTTLAVQGAHAFELVAGTIYVDNPGSVGTGLRIATPVGTAHDVGTQFELHVSGGIVRLRVREGRVEIERSGAPIAGSAGEQLEIGVLGDVRRTTIAADDPAWRWAESLAPAPDIDGRPATVLLEWVARETGHKLAYADSVIRQRAENVVLHGNIRHLAPLEALNVMLATTDLECILVGDTMEVRARNTR